MVWRESLISLQLIPESLIIDKSYDFVCSNTFSEFIIAQINDQNLKKSKNDFFFNPSTHFTNVFAFI